MLKSTLSNGMEQMEHQPAARPPCSGRRKSPMAQKDAYAGGIGAPPAPIEGPPRPPLSLSPPSESVHPICGAGFVGGPSNAAALRCTSDVDFFSHETWRFPSWFPLRVPCQAGLSGRLSFIDKAQCAANGARAVGALYPPKNSVPAHHHNLFGAAWNSLNLFGFCPGTTALGMS